MDPSIVVRAQERVGRNLRRDKYTLEALLGVGAMGAVYSASHRNGMRVAIKILHPELSRIQEVRKRFLREGYIANKVQHPGIVRVLDDDEDDDGSTFLVMDLLEGATLDQKWEAHQRRLPVAYVASVGVKILDVLAAVHGEGIVHRDLKPENTFITIREEVKLLDLGIARVIDSMRMTASGQMMGTPEYVAPEQAAGVIRDIDARTDIYSLGAMMFALVTGAFVHPARSGMEQMVFAATKPARSVFDVWPEAPPLIANVIDVALSFDKAKRWASALEMQRALRRSLDALGWQDSANIILPREHQPSQPHIAHTGTHVLGPMPMGGEQAPDSHSAIPLARPIRRG